MDDLEEGAATLFRELEIVSPLEHRNVIELIGGCWGFEEDELHKTCIAFELATRGSMRDYIETGLSRTAFMLCEVGGFRAKREPNPSLWPNLIPPSKLTHLLVASRLDSTRHGIHP